MNSSTSRWLVLLAVLLGGFILVLERRTSDTSQREAALTQVLPDLVVGEVTALEVARGTNALLRLVITNGGWQIVAPFAAGARAGEIERLLNGLVRLPVRSALTPEEVLAVTNRAAAFGVETPTVALTIFRGARRDQLRFGAPTLLGSQIYLQVVGQEGLSVVDRDVLQWLPGAANDWRDPALLRLGDAPLERVEVRPATNGFALARNPTNQLWRLTRPLETGANNARIEFLLQQLNLATVAQFVSDDSGLDGEPFGLQPPLRELIFARGTNEVAGLQIGRSPTNDPAQVYLRRLPSSNVVLVARSSIDPWLAQFPEFCDRRLVVFRLDDVERIEVRAAESFVVERRGTNDWRLVEPVAAPADRVLVLETLASLAGLEFVEFERTVVADFTAYGLEPPRRQYVLRGSGSPGSSGSGTAQRELGRLDIGNPKDTRFLARRMGENSVVTFYDNGRLPAAAFELRDRRLWNLSTNDIASITIEQAGETRTVLRTGAGQWSPAPGVTNMTVNSFTLEEAAWRLGHLRAERWVARGEDQLPRFGFGTVNHRVTIQAGSGAPRDRFSVRFGRRAASGRVYAAVELDGQPVPVIFECPADVYDYVRSDLLLVPDGA